MREEQVLPRGLLSRLLSGSFFFLALAPLGVLTAFAIGLQDAKIGVGIAVIIGAWAALQLGARSRWDPDSRRVLYGFGRFSLARQVPAGVDVQIIPGAEYRGAPWNGIGYFPFSMSHQAKLCHPYSGS